jgi:hypothetical protein
LATFIYGCRKNEDCIGCEVCEVFTLPDVRINGIFQKTEQERHPCFNPNNSNEFLFIKIRGGEFNLVKYVISEQKEEILLEDIGFTTEPKWGKNNKILFVDSRIDLHIFDLSTGFESIFDLKEKYVRFPEWKNDSIIVADISNAFKYPSNFATLNIFTNKIDTISKIYGQAIYYNETEFLHNYRTGIDFVDAHSTTTLIKGLDGTEQAMDSKWHQNHSDIFYSTNQKGLYKINRHTKKVTEIKNGCNSRFYRTLSIAPDGKKMLVHRVDAALVDGAVEEDASIYIMNLDGSDEQKIIIE